MNRVIGKAGRVGILSLFVLMIFGVGAPGFDCAGAAGWNEGIQLAGLFGSSSKTPAPDFELQDLAGSMVKLSRFRGDRAVMLYFWATWCPACISSKPHLVKVRERVPEKDLEILGINVGEGCLLYTSPSPRDS